MAQDKNLKATFYKWFRQEHWRSVNVHGVEIQTYPAHWLKKTVASDGGYESSDITTEYI